MHYGVEDGGSLHHGRRLQRAVKKLSSGLQLLADDPAAIFHQPRAFWGYLLFSISILIWVTYLRDELRQIWCVTAAGVPGAEDYCRNLAAMPHRPPCSAGINASHTSRRSGTSWMSSS